jgi:hypothetical protein
MKQTGYAGPAFARGLFVGLFGSGFSMQDANHPNWVVINPSDYPWEQEALDFIKSRFPTDKAYRAWSNFTFIANDRSGSKPEVDLLVFTPRGFFHIEIKSKIEPGWTLSGDNAEWTWERNGAKETGTAPMSAAEAKTRRLASLLDEETLFKDDGDRPLIETLIFCSAANLRCELQGIHRYGICLRDTDGQPGIMAAINERNCLGLRQSDIRYGPAMAEKIERALRQLGIRPSQQNNPVGCFAKVASPSGTEANISEPTSPHAAARIARRRLQHAHLLATTNSDAAASPVAAAGRTKRHSLRSAKRFWTVICLISLIFFCSLGLYWKYQADAKAQEAEQKAQATAEAEEEKEYEACAADYDRMLAEGATLRDFSEADQECAKYLAAPYGFAQRSDGIRAVKEWIDQAFDHGVIELIPEDFVNQGWLYSPAMKIELLSPTSTLLMHSAPKVKNLYDLGFLAPVCVAWKDSAGMMASFTVNQGTVNQDINTLAPDLLRAGRFEYIVISKDGSDYELKFAEHIYGMTVEFPNRP